MHHRESLLIETPGRSTTNITRLVAQVIDASGIQEGVATVFVHHTSASLILCENADPDVQTDLERFFARLVPDGDRLYDHIAEGPDDMPAHVRSVLTQPSISVPVVHGRCDFGTWQGIFLWEHRHAPHRRRVTVTVTG